jgi:cell division transport system permease protein
MSRGLFRAVMKRDAQASRVVMASGVTSKLTVFVAAVMAYLAVFSLAFSLSVARLAERWSDEMGHSATVRIAATADQQEAQTKATLRILQQTPGAHSVRPLSDDEQAELLAPWFGSAGRLDGLPMPRLIELQTSPRFDAEGLRQRLRGEVPGAVLDDHGRWRAPLVNAANGLRFLGWAAMGLIGAAMAAMITLAANASLAANAQIISVLRLVGARDGFIAQGFVRRFTWRGFSGATVGTVLAIASILALPEVADDGLLTGLGFVGAYWALPAMVPLVSAAVAFVATMGAAQRKLKGLI